MSLGILIAGTSHVGKSTLAEELGGALGWEAISTDKLARHPGRPWPRPPIHVEQFYRENSDEIITRGLLQHHKNVWPIVQQVIREKRETGKDFVFEGSALRPEFLADVIGANIDGVCLYADEDFVRRRIFAQSNYKQMDRSQQKLVDKFISRSLTDNRMLIRSARNIGMRCIDVSDARSLAEFKKQIIEQTSLSNRNQ